MPSNFSPHVPVKTSTYQNRGADYWLYGPQLKAKAQGLGLQMAGKMRSDITGIHEADMPYVKQLTDRVSRKREEYTNKLLDGADINDQLIKSMVGTFNENKNIQGSIKEAKINNQKIEQSQQMMWKLGMESGDTQFYAQAMSDSLREWGGTFKDGRVNPFQISRSIPNYADIAKDYQETLNSVRQMLTKTELAQMGDGGFKLDIIKTEYGNQLIWKKDNPDMLVTNEKKIKEVVDAFNRRMIQKPGKDQERGEYADFLDFRTRDDKEYLPQLTSKMKEMAQFATERRIDPVKDEERIGSFLTNKQLGIGADNNSSSRISEPYINATVRSEPRMSDLEYKPYEKSKDGVDYMLYDPEKGVTIGGKTAEEAKLSLGEKVDHNKKVVTSLIGEDHSLATIDRVLNTDKKRKVNIHGQVLPDSGLLFWARNLKDGDEGFGLAEGLKTKINNIKKNTSRLGLNLQGISITQTDIENEALYQQEFGFTGNRLEFYEVDPNLSAEQQAEQQAQLDSKNNVRLDSNWDKGKKPSKLIEKRHAEYEAKEEVIRSLEALNKVYNKKSLYSEDVRREITFAKTDTRTAAQNEKDYVDHVQRSMTSMPVYAFAQDGTTKTMIASNMSTKNDTDLTGGLDLANTDDMAKISNAMNTIGIMTSDEILVHKEYNYTTNGYDSINWIPKEVRDKHSKEVGGNITDIMTNANIVTVTVGKANPITFSMYVGGSRDQDKSPLDQSSNIYATLTTVDGEPTEGQGTVDVIFNNLGISESIVMYNALPGVGISTEEYELSRTAQNVYVFRRKGGEVIESSNSPITVREMRENIKKRNLIGQKKIYEQAVAQAIKQ